MKAALLFATTDVAVFLRGRERYTPVPLPTGARHDYIFLRAVLVEVDDLVETLDLASQHIKPGENFLNGTPLAAEMEAA